THPQALYGIADSPVGLAAWMLDHDSTSLALIARLFDGQAEGLTRDDVLDNITLYWLTNTGVSSGRLYAENTVGFFDPKGVSGPAELRGHVVLVNFWTLTCINWLRQEPYVRAWARAYRDDGLVVIGAHTPEFSFEQEIDLVRQATKEREIDYPVVVDNDYEVWN